VLGPTYKSNWPLKASSESFFGQTILSEVANLSLEDEPLPTSNGHVEKNGSRGHTKSEDREANGTRLDGDEDAAGWDIGEEVIDSDGAESTYEDLIEIDNDPQVVSSEADLWIRNSPVAAVHAAAGSFDTAMQVSRIDCYMTFGLTG